MDRIELLNARITLYRRYLSEGIDGDIARAYLWLIRKDEIELAAIARADKEESQKNNKAARKSQDD